MGDRLYRVWHIATTVIYSISTPLFLGVLLTSFMTNAVDMCQRIGLLGWRIPGNYAGLFAGFIAYIFFAIVLKALRLGHNLDWFRKFTHELTHTLVALLFFRKIYEFIVKGRECRVVYNSHPIGHLAITLSPYCIPIYTFMLFPFRFAGDAHYMIIFDALIAFTYAFHVHTFIKQTRFTQSDIKNCGIARSIVYISFTHLAVISLILATPKGGVLNALTRVFWEYPIQILTNPLGWAHQIIQYF
ncbi:MAG: hypothetical protein J6U93_01670 [Alistipes sp.]|nr:hypothetical protein [Alistipes sp.]